MRIPNLLSLIAEDLDWNGGVSGRVSFYEGDLGRNGIFLINQQYGSYLLYSLHALGPVGCLSFLSIEVWLSKLVVSESKLCE